MNGEMDWMGGQALTSLQLRDGPEHGRNSHKLGLRHCWTTVLTKRITWNIEPCLSG